MKLVRPWPLVRVLSEDGFEALRVVSKLTWCCQDKNLDLQKRFSTHTFTLTVLVCLNDQLEVLTLAKSSSKWVIHEVSYGLSNLILISVRPFCKFSHKYMHFHLKCVLVPYNLHGLGTWGYVLKFLLDVALFCTVWITWGDGIQEMVGDLLYCITEMRPLPAVKLTWTACDIIGHVINCQVCDVKWVHGKILGW